LLIKKKQIYDFSKCSYPSVGRCIYCGSKEDLEREHIIPYALGGTTILPLSTCRNCAKITGHFEQVVLRGPMCPVRKLLRLKSRTKHANAPKTMRLSIWKNEEEKQIEVPLEEYPSILYFPIFAPPGYGNEHYENGIILMGVHSICFGLKPEEVIKKYGADKLILKDRPYKPVEFAQTIAKIGYSYAVATGEIKEIKGQPLLLSALLGKSNDIGKWVCTSQKHEVYQNLLHRLASFEDKEKGLLIIEVQLFANSHTPIYEVIIGHLN
jgi:hypothetical protein